MGLGYRVTAHQAAGGGGEDAGDLLVFDEGSESDHKLAERLNGSDILQRRQAVECDPLRLEVVDDALDGDEPIFQTRNVGVVADDLEQTVALHLLEIESPADGV